MKIQYYGALCNCKDFQMQLKKACEELNINQQSLNITTNEEEAKKAGIPELPALVINDQLVVSGYIPSTKKLIKILQKH